MKLVTRIAVAVVVLAAAAIAGWMYLAPSEARVAPATVRVERGDIAQTVLATGALQANSVTSVGAEVSGTIQSVAVKLGDEVKKGDLIAQIDSTNQQNAVKSAEAALANLEAQLQAKQADLAGAQAGVERANKLAPQKLISDADMMTAEAALAAAKAAIASLNAQISQAKLAVDDANLALSRTRIIAPVDGTIVAVLVTEGQSVNANQTTPTIVKIADLDTMIIKAQISEADVTKVQPGQKATFTILGDPNTRIPATLLSIEPAPDAITTSDNGLSSSDNAVYYNGLFSVANADHRLRIAMTAQVTITIDERRNVLTLPASVLGTAGKDGNYRVAVYDEASGAVRPAAVKVGLNNNITAEVLSGLKEGDLVVSPRATAAPAAGNTARPPGGVGFLFGGGARRGG
ncbi:MAG TPA: efflux RND transporter periplasmic adaptor subunit [Devosia sp.]|nr:efflux RND transporter periplasmic adaptor subunit [Devosia sp.]